MNDQFDDFEYDDRHEHEYGVPAGFENMADFDRYCDEFSRNIDLEY